MTILLSVYLALVPSIFSVYVLDNFEGPKSWLTVLVAGLILPWLKLPRRISAIDTAVAFWLLVASVTTLTAQNPYRSLAGCDGDPMGLVQIAGLAVVYFGVRQGFRCQASRERIVRLLVVGSLPVILYALSQMMRLDPVRWGDALVDRGLLRPFATLGHPNDLGGYLVMLLPFSLYFGLRGPFMALLPLPIMAAIIATQSRGAWLAAAAAVFFAALAGRRSATARGIVVVFAAWAVLGVGGVTAAGLLLPGVGDALRFRLGDLLTLGPSREYYWKAAWQIFLDHPWLGVGLDSFRTAFEHVRSPWYWVVEPAGSIGKAHNDFLNTMATQGILGGISFVLTICTIAAAGRRALKSTNSERAFTVTVLASIVGYYVQNISGFPSLTTGALFMTLLAFMNRVDVYRDARSREILRRRFAVAYVIAALLTGAVFAYNFAHLPMKAQACAMGAASVSERDPKTALAMLDYAMAVDPRNGRYPAMFGNLADSVGSRELAARGFALAATVEPDEALHKFRLGLATGNKKFLEMAHQMEPWNPIFETALAQMN